MTRCRLLLALLLLLTLSTYTSFGNDIIHDHYDHHHSTFIAKDDHNHNNRNSNTNNNIDLCHDMYMTMYMDGFHWSLFEFFHPRHTQRSPICLNYFVSTWKIQYPNEFRGCMIYTFLLAILLEALSSIRTICLQYLLQPLPKNNNTNSRPLQQQRRYYYLCFIVVLRHVVAIMLYALQIIIGYLLMLIAMVYSIELFLSIVFGLIIGNGLFVRYNHDTASDNNIDDDDDDDIDDDGGNQPDLEEEHCCNEETQSLLSGSATILSSSTRANDGNIRRRG